MACYTWHLKSQGASPRAISAKYGDLNALGYLVLAYDAPKGKEVLNHLWPWDYEYSRKFSDAPRILARYKRTIEDFSRFVRESGLASNEE